MWYGRGAPSARKRAANSLNVISGFGSTTPMRARFSSSLKLLVDAFRRPAICGTRGFRVPDAVNPDVAPVHVAPLEECQGASPPF